MYLVDKIYTDSWVSRSTTPVSSKIDPFLERADNSDSDDNKPLYIPALFNTQHSDIVNTAK